MSRVFSFATRVWNPIVGCTNNCKYCIAREQAKKRGGKCSYCYYFVPHIHEKRFKPFRPKEKTIIFVVDAGDLFCNGVRDDWIRRVIDITNKSNENAIFLFLTKNPERYKDFLDDFNPNSILGATIETNRTNGYHEISNAPNPKRRYIAMRNLNWDKKFIAIEPIMDFDMGEFYSWIKDINPLAVTIGYDNNNNNLSEPPLEKTENFIKILKNITQVIPKKIRKAWYE